jgi:hypothetical protein
MKRAVRHIKSYKIYKVREVTVQARGGGKAVSGAERERGRGIYVIYAWRVGCKVLHPSRAGFCSRL